MRKETLEQEFAYHETNGKKPYFEGWYYKIQTSEVSVGVIVGIHYEKGIRNGFIQVLDTYRNISDYLVFPDEDIHIEEHKIKFKENELLVIIFTFMMKRTTGHGCSVPPIASSAW